MANTNGNGNGHSHEQGLRVHHLANLGGLIALAGLDLEPPDYLLGALLSVAQETRRLSTTERERVSRLGRTKLDQRATGKRAWKSWQRAQGLHALTLSGAQVRDIIEALGRKAPDDPTRLVVALSEALTEARA
ncbi:MAG TPA: conjugal transfer protein TraD [Candidatus Binataceae bacterium]|nr:conjugal transfer protein TraD [Candidatus Binataceae bacterium]